MHADIGEWCVCVLRIPRTCHPDLYSCTDSDTCLIMSNMKIVFHTEAQWKYDCTPVNTRKPARVSEPTSGINFYYAVNKKFFLIRYLEICMPS